MFRRNRSRRNRSWVRRFVNDWLVSIVVSFIIVKLITTFLIYKIVVPTGSMTPTVEAGDQLIAVKVYNPSWIKRGDILVFKSDELNELLLKRVIGLPGEHVEIKSDDSVYVNGEKINEDYVRNPGGKNDMTFDVPDGKYLMLGDNRVSSYDARYWRNIYIDGSEIYGKAEIIVYPLNRAGFAK